MYEICICDIHCLENLNPMLPNAHIYRVLTSAAAGAMVFLWLLQAFKRLCLSGCGVGLPWAGISLTRVS